MRGVERGVLLVAVISVGALAGRLSAQTAVRIDAGALEGTSTANGKVRVFLGVPFAAPPVGKLRWQAPQPVAPWEGVRKAATFGARCMQGPIYSDMIFRDGMSEDCLYLNVWAPADAKGLPVMFWIHGGGFQAGSPSEPRQDGTELARRGVIVVGANYRLGVFGFFAHPELTKESGRNASGNYGLLDQIATLQWIKRNIAAFGGDPDNVTIFGESAGSLSVSALMASPPAKGLFHRAIGESGAFFNEGLLGPKTLEASATAGQQFATSLGAPSLAALRLKPGADVLAAALKVPWFSPSIDGYVLPANVSSIYAAGKQAHVPLLAGWNADEARGGVVLGKAVTAASFTADVRERFGEKADALLKLYPAATDDDALESAAALATDQFQGAATWRWIQAHQTTGGSPVYRYQFDRKIPVPPDQKVNGRTATAKDIGARHAGEIEYVFGALDSVPGVTWEPADRALSAQMMSYWTNFARAGNPNGPGLPKWPAYDATTGQSVLHLDIMTKPMPDVNRARYKFLEPFLATPPAPTH
jgi:para-nitrobenzyl esterase